MLKNAHLSRVSRDSPAASPTWRRGKKSLLIRRDATLVPRRCSVLASKPHSAGLREPCIWALLIILEKPLFQQPPIMLSPSPFHRGLFGHKA